MLIFTNKDNTMSYVRIGIIISGIFSLILASFFTYAIDIWYTVGSFAVPALLLPLLFIYFNINLKFPFICMIIPIIITMIWFVFGYINQDGNSNFAYPYALDPMYPGVIVSCILCFINRKVISLITSTIK